MADARSTRRGVVAASAGNHAQAIALSARLLDMPAVIVMPEDAPTAKMAATREYGAQVVTYDRYTEDREAISQRLAELMGEVAPSPRAQKERPRMFSQRSSSFSMSPSSP